MKNITTGQYKILSDHMKIYDFMTEIYTIDRRNGQPAAFLEYALSSCWMDTSYTHKNRIWFDGQKIVGFVYTESPVTDIYFSMRPGYEDLADEMVRYAASNMPDIDGKQRLVILSGQTQLQNAADKNNFELCGRHSELIFTFDEALSHNLPDGYHFVEPCELNYDKVGECCYKGFDHEEDEGPWDGDAENKYHLLQAPHATPEHELAIANEQGDYVCWSGMWWTPENALAYMEPLCTVPLYRGRGLAAAALSEHYKRLKPLGATHMTGGSDKFYADLGFKPLVEYTFWKKRGS